MELFIGPANSGKTTGLLRQMAEIIKGDRGNPLLLIPSTNTAEILLKRLEAFLGQKLSKNSRPIAVTFPYFADSLLKRIGRPRKLLTTIQRFRLLQGILETLSAEKSLVYFSRIADKPGLVNSLANFLGELYTSGTNPESFFSLAEGRSAKDRDIALIYRLYDAALQQGGSMDSEGASLIALRALEDLGNGFIREKEPLIQKLRSLYPLILADGFDFYTPVQVKLLSRLSQLGIATAATLTFEHGRAVCLWQQPTLARFTKEGATLISCPKSDRQPIAEAAANLMRDLITEGEYESNNRKEKTRIDDQGDGKEEVAGPEAISRGTGQVEKRRAFLQIISAQDRAGEVRAVAREVKRLVLDEKYSLDEITIVCRSLSLYTYHLERIFEEFSIPLELDAQIPLAENPFIVSLLSLLRLGAEQFQRRAVIEALRTPYFDFSGFGLDEEQVDLLEQVSLDERIIQTREQWMEALEHPTKNNVSRSEGLGPAQPEPTRNQNLKARLTAFFDAVIFPRTASVTTYVRQILGLLETLRVEQHLLEGQKATLDILALRTFIEVLTSLRQDDEINPAHQSLQSPASNVQNRSRPTEIAIGWASFYKDLAGAIAATSVTRSKQTNRAILAQEAHNLRPRSYQAMAIIGLIEGEFPKKLTETMPYTRSERKQLSDLGIDFSETPNDAGADLTQFHKAMTRATNRLYLSYARTDLSGGELLKSYLIDEVRAVVNPEDLSPSYLEPVSARDSSLASLEEIAILTARRMCLPGVETDKTLHRYPLKLVSEWLGRNLTSWPATRRGSEIEMGRLTGKEQGRFGGVILNESLVKKIQARFGEDYSWSATKLNDYGLCPFRFFVGNVLNLSAIEEPNVGFAPDRLGVAYHEILEKTFKTFAEQGLELNEAGLNETIAIAENLCEVILENLLDEREIRQSLLWEFEKSEIKKRVINLLRAEALWQTEKNRQPILFEQSFGFGNQPPLVVDCPEGKIRIRGTIDRIDRGENGLEVIDYKTSRSSINAKEAVEGRNLQLPIYLMAADRLLRLEEEVAKGYYLHIHSCKKSSQFPCQTSSVEAIIKTAEGFIKEYVSKARHGEFPIQPNQNRCPPYCEFDVMCRIQAINTANEADS